MAGGETHDRKKEVGVERKKDKDWKCQIPLWHSKEESGCVLYIFYMNKADRMMKYIKVKKILARNTPIPHFFQLSCTVMKWFISRHFLFSHAHFEPLIPKIMLGIMNVHQQNMAIRKVHHMPLANPHNG